MPLERDLHHTANYSKFVKESTSAAVKREPGQYGRLKKFSEAMRVELLLYIEKLKKECAQRLKEEQKRTAKVQAELEKLQRKMQRAIDEGDLKYLGGTEKGK